MTITGIITAIIIGAIIGALGRLALPGRQKIGILWTIAVGIVAALIGTALVGEENASTSGIDWLELLAQVGLAALGVFLLVSIKGGRRTRSLR